MKTKLTIYPGGGIDCNSNECRWTKECANHNSAGDYRCEDGLSPSLNIISIFLGGADANCYSADFRFAELVPHNGAKIYKNGKVVMAPNLWDGVR